MRKSLLSSLRMSFESVGKIHKVSKLRGGIEGISKGIVFGWAVHRAKPQKALTLEFVLDGTPVGQAETVITRADIAVSAPSDYCCGFGFDLRPYLDSLTGQKLLIRDAESGEPLGKEPVVLDERSGWGCIDEMSGIEVRGWAVHADPLTEAAVVDFSIDGEMAGSVVADRPRPDLRRIGLTHGRGGFLFRIPCRWHDGESHVITGRIRGGESEIRGGGLTFKYRVQGSVDVLTVDRVSGWIVDVETPQLPVSFDLWVNGRCIKKKLVCNRSRGDVVHALGLPEGDYRIGFDVRMPPDVKWNKASNSAVFCLPGTTDNLLGRVGVAVDRYGTVAELERFASRLLNDVGSDAINDVIRTQLIPQLITQCRSDLYSKLFMLPVREGLQDVSDGPGSRKIDVIIPVYKGYEETLDCIRSVLETRDECLMELIVINDRSPDALLSAELRKLADKESFTLLENTENRGFVATVNRGMKLHAQRDVLLLNSDTVVPKGWLKNLRRAAYSSSSIATVTPFSNRATIFSLPRTCYDNDMPLDLSVDVLNALCAQFNRGVVVDVPTAVGFCMYIRRDALNEVGFFDEERWKKGYGEENDFCLRAATLGWRNVAACDVFVQHHGSVSFDAEKGPRVQENLAVINRIYPDYPQRVERFLESDPLAVPRSRVNVALLKRLAPSYILFVTHGLGGGTEKAVRDLCKLHETRGKKVLILRSTPTDKLELTPAIKSHEDILVTELPSTVPTATLADLLRKLSIEYVHFHHTLGFQSDIWQLPELLDVPYDVMLHDFYLVCPRINLIDDTGLYCGQPETPTCELCVKASPLDHGVGEHIEAVGGSVAHWRDFHAEQLRNARQVVTPSEDAREHIARYFPDVSIEAISHPEPPFTFSPRAWDGTLPFRVAVIGAIGPHKGVDLLLACARYARQGRLPIQFVVIGYTSCDKAFAELDNVVITGSYKPSELQAITKAWGCTVALFLSVWPETFSYTLSEAWRMGLYPVSLDIGAPAERIRAMGIGTLIPFTQRPGEILSTLLDVLDVQGGGRPEAEAIHESQQISL